MLPAKAGGLDVEACLGISRIASSRVPSTSPSAGHFYLIPCNNCRIIYLPLEGQPGIVLSPYEKYK